MKLTFAALSITSLAAAVEAAFTLNIRWSNSPLSGPIGANSSSFWTGIPIESYCPPNIPECVSVNTTSFLSNSQGSLFLNDGVPGGQQGISPYHSKKFL